jgi:hypothetical protein
MAELLDQSEIYPNSFEPKLANRFIMYIDGIPSFMIKMTNRPSISIPRVTLDHINMKRYIAGKPEWQELSLSLYDPIVPSAAQATMEWIRLCFESVTGRMGYSDFYKKDITLNAVGPVGDIVESWNIQGAFVTNFEGGQLDWSSGGDPVMVNLSISYDNCILNF